MASEILCINNYLSEIEKNFLESGDKKYINVCKKFYGANIDKISIHIWTLHIMDDFEDNIKKLCKDMDNIEIISQQVYKLLKEDRKKMILYAYLKGHISGYNDYVSIKKIRNIYVKISNDKIRKISKKDIEKNEEINRYINFIKCSHINRENIKLLTESIESHYLKTIKQYLLNINFKCDKDKLIDIIKELMRKDTTNKYNEGILDGIIHKINKKSCKNDKMNL